MGNRKGTLYNFGVSLFKRLTGIYPDRFRRQFAGEIFDVLRQKLEGASTSGGLAIPACILHETTALMASIIREHWHDRWGGRDVGMVEEKRLYREIDKIFLRRRLKSAMKVTFALAGIIVLLNSCSYLYAGIQIAQVKHWGVYPTLEEAVYGVHSINNSDAKVMRIDINHIEPCFSGGEYPFVMCVTSKVFDDHTPTVPSDKNSSVKSAYFHLEEGWVFMPEGNTRFTARVVELLGMQATDE